VEVQKICGLLLQLQNGGKSGGEEDNTSLTSRTIRHLMSSKERMLKDKRSLLGKNTMDLTRDGELCMLTQQRKKEQADGIKNTDSISIDHSTSDQECQCGELLIMFPIILDSEDMSKVENDIKHSNLIECLTLSSLSIPNPIHFTSTVTEVDHTSN
jgi:hypothetical protein